MQILNANEFVAARARRRATLSDAHGLGTDAIACDALRCVREALLAMCAADALASPLHWYYSPGALRHHRAVYARGDPTGMMRRFSAVLPQFVSGHPDSAKYFQRWVPDPAMVQGAADRRAWQTPGMHYHAKLRPGETTTTVQLALLALRVIGRSAPAASDTERATATSRQQPRYEDAYLREYVDYFASTSRRTDTYIEQVHRDVFAKLASGRFARPECGAPDACLSGLTAAMPVLLLLLLVRRLVRAQLGFVPVKLQREGSADLLQPTVDQDRDRGALFELAVSAASRQMQLTHRSTTLEHDVQIIARLCADLLECDSHNNVAAALCHAYNAARQAVLERNQAASAAAAAAGDRDSAPRTEPPTLAQLRARSTEALFSDFGGAGDSAARAANDGCGAGMTTTPAAFSLR